MQIAKIIFQQGFQDLEMSIGESLGGDCLKFSAEHLYSLQNWDALFLEGLFKFPFN